MMYTFPLRGKYDDEIPLIVMITIKNDILSYLTRQ